MTRPSIVDALASGRVEMAKAIVFEYLALTQGEAGFPVPQGIGDLPPQLRAVCESIAEHYREPGALLLALLDEHVCGCVGIVASDITKPTDALVQRLYVRAPYRRLGLARRLMQAAQTHAAQNGFQRVVLNVLPARRAAIALYETLHYQPQSYEALHDEALNEEVPHNEAVHNEASANEAIAPVAVWPYPTVWFALDLSRPANGSDGAGVMS
jgi:ribosomal protein S18 acetylase RimI-like enzyme